MFLLDTSVIVSALVEERRTEDVQDWLARHAGDLAISAWALTEISSALALRQRVKQLSERDRLASLELFDEFAQAELDIVDVTRADFEDAARLCDDAEPGLRAPDALHLAVALRTGRTLVTLDQKLFRAAAAVGCRPEMP